MYFNIVAIIPELLKSGFEHSILKRAQTKGLVEIDIVDLRKYGKGNYNQIDDYQYGGGAGMVIMPEPLSECIKDQMSNGDFDEIIFLTPDGELYDQHMANELSLKSRIMMICGHYKGIDERIRQKYVTREISIGDYVLSGGELAAGIVVDSIVRLIPGVIGDESSALSDSFQNDLLAPPVYTRPAEYEDMRVPDILLSGNEAKIDEWRNEQALLRTRLRRPDLFNKWEEL